MARFLTRVWLRVTGTVPEVVDVLYSKCTVSKVVFP